MEVRTRILIISDTHGESTIVRENERADVAIHCGDLTEESKIAEFRTAIQLLRSLDAPLKLVIAGNHDFTLDTPAFMQKVSEAAQPLEPELVRREYGGYGEARRLLQEASNDGIVFLEEGHHQFALGNGASMSVYASPFTPSQGGWGFQYSPEKGHEFSISKSTDIVISHGPPHGIMDYTEAKVRAGCPNLFGAVARARPRLHCFGHIHEGWGARLVAWRAEPSGKPSHFTDIDNGRSTVIAKLSGLIPGEFDTAESAAEKQKKAQHYVRDGCCRTSHCSGDQLPLQFGAETLFVNAAIQGSRPDLPIQPAWLVEIDLPAVTTEKRKP